jgi:flagellar FliL protein
MADEDVQENEGNENDGAEDILGDEKSGNKKKLLLVVLPVMLLAIGGGLYFTGVIGGAPTEETITEDAASDDADTNSAFFALPDLIVNLSSETGARFLKLRVQFEIKDEAAIETVTPRVIDQFQTYLREMRVEDLRGSAGIYRLRQELLYRVNVAAHPIEVRDVLFQEMLIQ